MAEREESTQDPSANRQRQAHQKGQFARSREFAVAVTWLAGVALLVTFGSALWQALQKFGVAQWTSTDISVAANENLGSSVNAAESIFWSGLLPILAGVAGVAAVVWWGQSGFRFFPGLAAPDVSRLSPARNLGRVFESESFVSVALGLFKFLGLLLVSAWIFVGDIETISSMGRGPLASSSLVLADWLVSVVQRLCLAAVVVGLLDYSIRWQLNRRALRMTDQEMRDEQRSMEASPEVSARRRLIRQR